MSTVTTGRDHGLRAGDVVTLEIRDTRWWRRLLYWMLRRGTPKRVVRQVVGEVTSDTFTINLP